MKINNQKKFPKLVGIFALLLLLFFSILATNQLTTLFSQAGQSCSPINIQITNLTFQSFDISFLTSKDCHVIVDTNSQIFTDSRQINTGKTHYFQIDSLNQNTTYPYKFISEGKNYTHPSYTVTTFNKPNQAQPNTAISWGRVFTPENKPAIGSIIYLNIPDVYPLSSYVTNQAYWNIPLANSFSIDGKNLPNPPQDTIDEIIVLAPDGQITLLTNNTYSRNPIPDIILGNTQFQSLPGSIEFDKLTNHQNSNQVTELILHNPAEGESINNSRPYFFGQGPADATIEIELNSPTKITDSVFVSPDGSWQWTPPSHLEPGLHSITLKYNDPVTGILKTISRNFTVLAQSDQTGPAFTASQSAVLVTSTPTAIQQPTTSPTSTPQPLSTSIPTKAIPSPTPSILPQSGNFVQTLTIIVISLFFITTSIIFII